MPTLGTHPIHKTWRQKLQNPHSEDEVPSSASAGSMHHVATAKGARIHTPQAFLSRDPQQICDMIGNDISLKEVMELRFSVASSLIENKETGHGEESNRIKERLNKKLLKANITFTQLTTLRKRANFIPGSFTAVDYCLHEWNEEVDEDQLQSLNKKLMYLSTGSQKLDKLLSPCTEYLKCLQSTISNMLQKDHHSKYSCISTPLTATSGIFFGLITEFMGPPASGKTQLTLSVAANAALQKRQVHYLASGGGNSTIVPLARRLLTIMKSILVNKNRNDPSILTQALQNVHFYSIQDGYHALSILNKAQEKISQDFSETSKQKAIFVLDSASGCLSPALLGSRKDGGVASALVNEVGQTLLRYSRIYQHAILVTNGTTVKRSTSTSTSTSNTNTLGINIPQPAMKNMWNVADVRVWMDIVEDVYNNSNTNTRIQQASQRKIRVGLDKHYAKSCHYEKVLEDGNTSIVECAISSCGIVDF